MSPEIHTRLHPDGGIETYQDNSAVRRTVINPTEPSPVKPRQRYSLPGWVFGKLEVLAKSRIELPALSGKTSQELRTWSVDNSETVWSVVHTVHASSRIEDEGVHANEVPVIYHAITKTLGQNTQELSQRQAAERDISLAYFWALSGERRPLLSNDFILELHRKMFANTHSAMAGCFKTIPVIIADDEKAYFDVTTLPPEKVETFLSALCERTNRAFKEADQMALHSKLILTAEFLVDFLAIHPFQDGNGRTARLLSTYLLENAGYHFAHFYPIDQVILDSRNKYFEALFGAQENWYLENENLSPWIEFYVDAVFKQWERAFREIRDNAMKKSNGPE